MRRPALAILGSLLFLSLLASEPTQVEGVVQGEQGQAIAGARVRLLNAATGYRAVRYTTPQGQFIFEDVPFARGYLLTVEAAGFGLVVREDLSVTLPGTLALTPVVLPETQNRFGSFWLDKPSAQWTDEEALQLATDSPWARPAMVRSAGELHVLPPERALRVQWLSARAVRAALGQLKHLPPAESEQLLTRELPSFHLILFAQVHLTDTGYDYDPLVGIEFREERAGKESYLEFSPSGSRVPPSAVVPLYSEGEPKQLVGVNFFFSRLEVRPELEQSATLVVPQAERPLQVTFDLGRMLFRGRPDL